MTKTRSARLKSADKGQKSKIRLALAILTVVAFALDGIAIFLLIQNYTLGQPVDYTWFIVLTIIGLGLSVTSEVMSAVERYNEGN